MVHPPLISLFDNAQGAVAQRGRNDATLRRPGIGAPELLLCQDSGFQELHQQSIHRPVGTVPPDPLHQQMMVDVIETALDIALDDPLIRDLVTLAVLFAYAARPDGRANVL